MSIGVMLFCPFTGKPRHPSDIQSDPQGILVWDGEEPLRAYTPPAQRKPLTDEEIKKLAAPLFMTHYWKLCNEFARAIEAKLKELNT